MLCHSHSPSIILDHNIPYILHILLLYHTHVIFNLLADPMCARQRQFTKARHTATPGSNTVSTGSVFYRVNVVMSVTDRWSMSQKLKWTAAMDLPSTQHYQLPERVEDMVDTALTATRSRQMAAQLVSHDNISWPNHS